MEAPYPLQANRHQGCAMLILMCTMLLFFQIDFEKNKHNVIDSNRICKVPFHPLTGFAAVLELLCPSSSVTMLKISLSHGF